MKKVLVIVFAFLICSGLFAEKIKIYAPVAQQMLVDKNNFVRYSPVNMFDDNSDTVYAVTFDEIDCKKPLLEIYFGEPAVFDKITIKPGYFDDRYFEKNDRIKNLRVKIFNCNNLDGEKSVLLEDKMEEQTIYCDKKMIATKLVIYAESVYSGSKWNDLVISDLNFFLENIKTPVSFDVGKCVNVNVYRKYKYDDMSRVIHEYVAMGKSGAKDVFYKYEGEKVKKASAWDGEKVQDSDFKEIDSIVMDFNAKEELIYVKDALVAKKHVRGDDFYISQCIYENAKIKATVRICENRNWSEKCSIYNYDSLGRIFEVRDYGDGTAFKKRFE
ncbi:MAG: hypothetical protein MJ188_00040 [Treponema sp.]|nr:hypothetical protein [Treponema sp.]